MKSRTMRWQIIGTKEKKGVGTTHPKTNLTKMLKKRFTIMRTCSIFYDIYLLDKKTDQLYS